MFMIQNHNMKGQYFIISALLLVLGFYIVTPFPKIMVRTPADDLIEYSENLEREMRNAFNLGVNQSDEMNVMVNFSRYLDSRMGGRYINSSMLWVLCTNTSTGSINFTGGNFFDDDKTVYLSMPADSNITLMVSSNSTNSTVISAQSTVSFLEIRFDDLSYNTSLIRYKSSLFGYIQLDREDNRVIKKFFA